jgi:serine/threonine protein kinase
MQVLNSNKIHLSVKAAWQTWIVLTCFLVLCASSKVAALFKIGNSRELPPIPDHLSEDGKDFVRLCLQRNPIDRPNAAQLLEHAFVKNAAPLVRPILSADPSDAPPVVTNAVRFLVQA